jgi:hypothetical protein
MVVVYLSRKLESCGLKFYRGAADFSNPGPRVESSTLKSYDDDNA